MPSSIVPGAILVARENFWRRPMKRSTSIMYAAVLIPSLVVGMSAAVAGDKKCDCPCDSEHTDLSAEKNHGQQGAEKSAMASKKAKEASKARAEAKSAIEAQYLRSKSSSDYFSGNIIGHDVMNRRDNKVIGMSMSC